MRLVTSVVSPSAVSQFFQEHAIPESGGVYGSHHDNRNFTPSAAAGSNAVWEVLKHVSKKLMSCL